MRYYTTVDYSRPSTSKEKRLSILCIVIYATILALLISIGSLCVSSPAEESPELSNKDAPEQSPATDGLTTEDVLSLFFWSLLVYSVLTILSGIAGLGSIPAGHFWTKGDVSIQQSGSWRNIAENQAFDETDFFSLFPFGPSPFFGGGWILGLVHIGSLITWIFAFLMLVFGFFID